MNTPLLTVCAWCDLMLGYKSCYMDKAKQAQAILEGSSISHGICEPCRNKELEQWRESQRKANANL